MVDVLVILDGASEPLGSAPTSLERARTPVLDALVYEGELSRVRTVAAGLPAGSESAIPALLGWIPPAPVDRGALEAAACDVEVASGHRVWRVDVLIAGRRATDAQTRATAAHVAATASDHTVRHIGGHRLLIVGPEPLPTAARSAGLRVWPHGVIPPRTLDHDVVVVAASGAAVGAARLLGASVVTPPACTGGVDTDLQAKAAAAIRAIAAGARRVVVHIGAPDEAAHKLDPTGKVAAIERIDAELLGPLADAIRAARATFVVCPDHGCDPATGEHDTAPVPSLRWPGAHRAFNRLTERAVAGLPILAPMAAAA